MEERQKKMKITILNEGDELATTSIKTSSSPDKVSTLGLCAWEESYMSSEGQAVIEKPKKTINLMADLIRELDEVRGRLIID